MGWVPAAGGSPSRVKVAVGWLRRRGRAEAAVFPGDLPQDAASLLAAPAVAAVPDSVHFLKFRPARVSLESPSGEEPALPHIRLDRAIEFLIGDRLI